MTDPLHNSSKTPRVAERPNLVVVVHPSVPGPLSADPRNRQIFRRLLDLRELGFEVTLVPIELLPGGGAPNELRDAGIQIEHVLDEPLTRRLQHLNRSGDSSPSPGIYITTINLTRSHRDALALWSGPIVVDLDHLGSDERKFGRRAFRESEQPGIDTELAHLIEIEAGILACADLVITVDPAGRDRLQEAHGATASHVAVVPPSLQHTTAKSDAESSGLVLIPARFSSEWGTPDEAALSAVADVLASASVPLSHAILTPEDSDARLRYRANDGLRVAKLNQVIALAGTASVALDIREFGMPTVLRRAEWSSAGLVWLGSSTAVGANTAQDERFKSSVVDSATTQAESLRRLIADSGLRHELLEEQQAALIEAPDQTRALLGEALQSVGVTPGPPRTLPDGSKQEYSRVATVGTLAGVSQEAIEIESEMMPTPLYSRDRSVNLQSALDPDERYRVYAATHLEAPPVNTPTATDASRRVKFSVLVPTYNTDPQLLDECIRSVVAQTHANWEMCLVDDGSTTKDHLQVLDDWARKDERVRIQKNEWNQGIALATNDALSLATPPLDGEHWICLLDHDDVYKPDALGWVARYASESDEHDVWYSDEDKILMDGQIGQPFFKPDWSPELLLGVNYVCHLLAVRAELMQEVGGFRAGFDGAQDYDLVLRLSEAVGDRGHQIGHIAKPLYSWRMIPGSTALSTGEKPAAHGAGGRAIQDSLNRQFQLATVEDGLYDTTHRVRYSVDTSQLLTIMIPTRDRADLLKRCVNRVLETSHGLRIELLVVDNDSDDPETLRYLEELISAGHQVVRYPHEFSFARQVNIGALHAKGDLLLILNNDTWPKNEDWLLRMMEHAQRPEVGLVGARLMFPEGMRGNRPQHEGIVMGMAGLAYNIDLGGYMGIDQFVRNTSGVTAACVMLRPQVLLNVGGMEERLRVAYNDVDFGLRVSEWGYRVLYTPHAVLEHPESASRGDLHPTEDEEWLVQRWGPKGSVREPFISPHLEWLVPVIYKL